MELKQKHVLDVETDRFQVWQAARATIALPNYFPPLQYKSEENETMLFSDANEHIVSLDKIAIHEAGILWPNIKSAADLDLCLSVGDGTMADPLQYAFERAERIAYEKHNKLFRLSPEGVSGLPSVDDFEALKKGESLDTIASNYFGCETVQNEMSGLVISLLATSFYFQAMEKDEREGVVLKGKQT